LGLMMGLLTACGADKPMAPSAPKTVAPPKAVITPPAVKPVATKPPAAKPPAYVIPASLFSGEVKRVYPRGKRRKAKKLNRSGLKARRKGDTVKALALYKESIAASPSFVTARFNLACEYARFGKATETIGELEHLFRIGTPYALAKVAKLQVDKDFDPVRNDPRIKAIVRHFDVDFDQPLFKQLCANAGKAVALIKPAFGVYRIFAAGGANAVVVAGHKHISAGKGRSLIADILELVCDDGKIVINMGGAAVLVDTRLSKWTAKYKRRCVRFDGVREDDGSGTTIDHDRSFGGRVCFIRRGKRWIIGATGHWSIGEQDRDMGKGIKRAVKKAENAWFTEVDD
jgi:hypothetical protein